MFLANRHFQLSQMIKDFSNQAKISGAKFILEKTPRHIWHIDYIRRVQISPRFIVTTRDGREVIASLYERLGDFEASCQRYLDDSFMSLRQLDMNDTRLIKLEQFSTEPRQELAAVFKWLGLRFEEGVLDYHKQPISWNLINSGDKSDNTSHDLKRNMQVNSELAPAKSHWRERLPNKFHKDLYKMFEGDGVGRRVMQQFGYDV